VELPTVPAENRTVGRTFTAPGGQIYRPSMFVTLTLGSYGRIVVGRGVPARHSSYDYRRAAREALFFPRLVDRWVQNLRRCAGFRVQYFGAIEPRRRLAPHIHLALRGAIPREVLRDVTRATYLQLCWPAFDVPVHVDEIPVWDATVNAYWSRGAARRWPPGRRCSMLSRSRPSSCGSDASSTSRASSPGALTPIAQCAT
jgi:hypothetical protein